MRIPLLLFIFLNLAPAAFGALPIDPGQSVSVSLLQLVATPERFDGKLVRVVGYLWIEFEGTALYLHKEDRVHHLMKNSIFLNLPESDLKRSKELTGRYALVEGVFNSSDTGHMGLFSGSIHSIRRVSAMTHRGGGLTFRSTRTPPTLPSALSLVPSSSASLSASAQAGPVSFDR